MEGQFFIMKSLLKILLFVLFVNNYAFSQQFTNGSFENNTVTVDQINLSNSDFNSMMSDCNGYGTNGNLDIITSSTYSGGANEGDWFIALTGNGTDELSLKLSSPLISGQTYTISFFDKAHTTIAAKPIEIGLSASNNSFGTLIYTTPNAATSSIWTQRLFSFVATSNAQYVTIRQQGDFLNWVHVDNFTILCPTEISIGNDTTICLGAELLIGETLIDTPFVNYYWYNSFGVIIDSSISEIEVLPLQSTFYVLKKQGCGLSFFDTIFINVNDKCIDVPETELIIPNILTPNGDGLNDRWNIEIGNKELVSFVIYNRWGIEQSNSKSLNLKKSKTIVWDGHTTSGVACSEGIYYYIIEVKNSKGEIEKHKGYISLVR